MKPSIWPNKFIKIAWIRLLRLSVIFGSCWLVLAATSTSAKPVVLPMAEVGEGQMNLVLSNEKLLLLILLANAVHIITGLIKGLWNSREKEAKNTSKKLEELSLQVIAINTKIEKLISSTPDEDDILKKIRPEIELMVFRLIDKGRRN